MTNMVQLMQEWADYLDRLRTGEEIQAGTQGTATFPHLNIVGDRELKDSAFVIV